MDVVERRHGRLQDHGDNHTLWQPPTALLQEGEHIALQKQAGTGCRHRVSAAQDMVLARAHCRRLPADFQDAMRSGT